MTPGVWLCSTVLLLIAPVSAGAQAPPAAAPPAQHAGGPPDLGPWWEKSSLSYDPVPEKTLLHVASDFQFTDARGNTSGHSISKHTDVVVRKRRITNRVLIDIRDSDMSYGAGGGANDYHMSTIREHVEYDLSKRALVLAGVENYRNSLYFIDRRLTAYVGGGATIASTATHTFSMTGGLGYTGFAFDRDGMLQIAPDTVPLLPTLTPKSGGVMLNEAWHWKASKQLTIDQSASITEFFDQKLGQTWSFSVAAHVPVNKHVSIGPRYDVHEEDNVYIEALPVKTIDRTFGIGVKVSF
jgi:hypothetical protein